MFKHRNERPSIEFVSTVDGLSLIEDVLPKPANQFIPKWWKDLPNRHAVDDGTVTAKHCPMFPDYFSTGYILPMWADTLLKYDEQSDHWQWQAGRGSPFRWDIHGKPQLIDHVTPHAQGERGKFIFKAINPWRIITPKGYSVYQLPMFWEFNEDFTVLPGIRHTDILHQSTVQILFHSQKNEIFIPKGTPLVQYLLFKREETTLSIREATEADQRVFNAQDLRIRSSFRPSNDFRSDFKKHNNQ